MTVYEATKKAIGVLWQANMHVLAAVLVSLVYIVYRKQPYTAFNSSMQGPTARTPTASSSTPTRTSATPSSPRHSLEAARRSRSESASSHLFRYLWLTPVQ